LDASGTYGYLAYVAAPAMGVISKRRSDESFARALPRLTPPKRPSLDRSVIFSTILFDISCYQVNYQVNYKFSERGKVARLPPKWPTTSAL
jgi:hypothetical protein